MSTTACSSYDEVPYASYPYPESHPDRAARFSLILIPWSGLPFRSFVTVWLTILPAAF